MRASPSCLLVMLYSVQGWECAISHRCLGRIRRCWARIELPGSLLFSGRTLQISSGHSTRRVGIAIEVLVNERRNHHFGCFSLPSSSLPTARCETLRRRLRTPTRLLVLGRHSSIGKDYPSRFVIPSNWIWHPVNLVLLLHNLLALLQDLDVTLSQDTMS